MTHYNRHYDSPDREANDSQAIADIQEYLNSRQWATLMTMVGQATPAQCAETELTNEHAPIETIRWALDFTGVRGYPVAAFCRRYALQRYREWMASGDDAVQTDAEGFTI